MIWMVRADQMTKTYEGKNRKTRLSRRPSCYTAFSKQERKWGDGKERERREEIR